MHACIQYSVFHEPTSCPERIGTGPVGQAGVRVCVGVAGCNRRFGKRNAVLPTVPLLGGNVCFALREGQQNADLAQKLARRQNSNRVCLDVSVLHWNVTWGLGKSRPTRSWLQLLNWSSGCALGNTAHWQDGSDGIGHAMPEEHTCCGHA